MVVSITPSYYSMVSMEEEAANGDLENIEFKRV